MQIITSLTDADVRTARTGIVRLVLNSTATRARGFVDADPTTTKAHVRAFEVTLAELLFSGGFPFRAHSVYLGVGRGIETLTEGLTSAVKFAHIPDGLGGLPATVFIARTSTGTDAMNRMTTLHPTRGLAEGQEDESIRVMSIPSLYLGGTAWPYHPTAGADLAEQGWTFAELHRGESWACGTASIDVEGTAEIHRFDVNCPPLLTQLHNTLSGDPIEQALGANGNPLGNAVMFEHLILEALRTQLPSPDTIMEQRRVARRDALIQRIRGNDQEARREEARAGGERRAASRARLETFLSRPGGEVEVIPTLPFVPHGLASSRRWGIEIESGGARGVAAPAGWSRKGDGSLRSAWEGFVEVEDFEPYDEEVHEHIAWTACETNDHSPLATNFDPDRQEWVHIINPDYIPAAECTACGNVTRIVRHEPRNIAHYARTGDCAEFVSPILVSMHSNGLESLLTELAIQPQNATAGVHVHVEASDLTQEQINTLVFGYGMIEALVTSSYRREVRNYCRPISAAEVVGAAEAKGRNTFDRGERYESVNRHALDAHGTIEFRSMGPVYEYDYLIRWAMFCREMVNVVKAGATQEEFSRAASSWDAVLMLFAKYGKEYVRAVVYETTGETGEWARLSKEESPALTELGRAANVDLAAWTERLNGSMARAVGDIDSLTARLVTVQDTLASV